MSGSLSAFYYFLIKKRNRNMTFLSIVFICGSFFGYPIFMDNYIYKKYSIFL